MIRGINMETNELRLEAQDLNQQGAMLLKAGNVESARVKFDRAIEIDPRLNKQAEAFALLLGFYFTPQRLFRAWS